MKQLLGHTSPETAYLVEDYPYGFRLRTQIRYWIETRNGFGQRFCSQTLNPKNGKWNKPKCSTYEPVTVLGLAEDSGYVKAACVTNYSDAGEIAVFADKYQLDSYQAAWCASAIKAKRQYDAKKKELEAAGLDNSYGAVIRACVADDIAAIKANAQAACDATDKAFGEVAK